jgi:hypothetical protein
MNPAELNVRLIEMMDSLRDKNMSDDQLAKEAKRIASLNSVVSNIIKHNALTLKTALAMSNSLADVQLPSNLDHLEHTPKKEKKLLEK